MLGQGIAQLQQAGIRVDVEKIGARFGVPMKPAPQQVEEAGGADPMREIEQPDNTRVPA